LNDSSIVDLYVDYERGKMVWRIVNKSTTALSGFAVAINKNAIGFCVDGRVEFPNVIEGGDVQEIVVPLKVDGSAVGNFDKSDLQIALRTNQGTIYALDEIPAQIATAGEGKIEQDEFRRLFQVYSAVVSTRVEDAIVGDDSDLNSVNVFVVGRNGAKTYVSLSLCGQVFVGELTQEKESIVVNIKGESAQLFPVIQVSARALFSKK
jgi:hypothetical protein